MELLLYVSSWSSCLSAFTTLHLFCTFSSLIISVMGNFLSGPIWCSLCFQYLDRSLLFQIGKLSSLILLEMFLVSATWVSSPPSVPIICRCWFTFPQCLTFPGCFVPDDVLYLFFSPSYPFLFTLSSKQHLFYMSCNLLVKLSSEDLV